MACKEIVTLQIGHYSNFVGTHWWNIQESSFVYDPKEAQKRKDVDNDVLFREGQNLHGEETYTPRLVAFDLKGSLQTLKQEGVLYEHKQQEDIKWTGDITLHKSENPPKNRYLKDLEEQEQALHSVDEVEIKDATADSHSSKQNLEVRETVFGKKFYNLDESVSVWSDFLKTYLHPKSIQIIEQYTFKNELQPFDTYGCGQEVVSNYETRSEIEDRLHFFLEECDQLQGFHVLVDTHDGFGGIGSHVLQYLEDDFTTKGIFTLGLTPNNLPDDTPTSRANRILNSAISYSKCLKHSSLFTPLSLASNLWKKIGPPVGIPHLDYKNINYHTSAVLAATLDTVTAPYRAPNSLHMRDITDNFSSSGRKVASMSTTFPYLLKDKQNFIDSLLACDTLPWTSLTPHTKNELSPFMQSITVRGIPDTAVSSRPGEDPRLPRLYSTCTDVNSILQVYLGDKFPSTMNAGSVYRSPCQVGTPFPHIFDEHIDKNGLLSSTKRPQFQGVDSVAMMSCLHSTPEIGCGILQTLHNEASKLNIKKHHRFLEAGLEEDDYVEILCDINSLIGNYTDKNDMG